MSTESAKPAHSTRPELNIGMSEEEFQRWYWLKEELAAFARELGIRASGGKELLANRVAAKLGGRVFVEPTPVRSAVGAQLLGELSASTVIPAGQRSSQVIRAWMVSQLGPTFHFDAEMRAFFADSDGSKTMQDAVDHWTRTRNQEVRNIDAQFEYNRFTRSWHENNPNGARDELLAAWKEYRGRPIDERGRA